jgi:hypothetical protein
MFPISIAGNAVPGKKDLLKACVAHNVGLVAMKPFGGGKLLRPWRTATMGRWQTGGPDVKLERSLKATPVQCLHYVLTQVGVSTVVPGCKDLKELATDLRYWEATEEEKDFSDIVSDFQQYITGECVYCNHCLPCPSSIDIGQTIRLLEIAQHNMTPELKVDYGSMESDASDCMECGACEERCPFDVSVIEKMEMASRMFR